MQAEHGMPNHREVLLKVPLSDLNRSTKSIGGGAFLMHKGDIIKGVYGKRTKGMYKVRGKVNQRHVDGERTCGRRQDSENPS